MTDTTGKLPGLSAKTKFLLQPEHYPEATTCVELVETHMARVFLTDHFAYKMKKPVRSSYLDFSSLDKRYGVCREELRLNRRLTDDVYLGLVPLQLTADQRLSLRDGGTPVEWLVKMRRLPESACLANRIEKVAPQDLAPLLERLCAFYRSAPPVPLSGSQYMRRLREQCQQLHRQLQAPAFELDKVQLDRVAAALLHSIEQLAPLLSARAEAGKIIEGHGDLRPEHCFLTDPPQVIDCLEFNRVLRCVDPLDELSYLALECELLGREDLADVIVSSHYRCSEDEPGVALSRFYRSYRAFLRAQLAVAHLLDHEVAEPEKWKHKARLYLQAAAAYSNL